MKKPLVTSLILGLLMAGSAVLTKAVTPTVKIADTRARFSLEILIPERFGDWEIDRSIAPLQIDPEVQAKLNKIYNQTLSRTYVDSKGRRVMLSMAYGGDQSDNMGVHKPEICYAAQGFEITRQSDERLQTDQGSLPVKRLMAINGNRNEPISYWITIGDKATKPGMEQRLEQLRYGLSGTVPDGMLVRVSSIDTDLPGAYKMQDAFVNEMLRSLPAAARTKLVGVFSG
jgi:EpsI family protein